MKSGIVTIIAVAMLGGCCTHERHIKPEPASQPRAYAPAASGSLVFDPPVIAGQPRLELSREDRSPAAFVGYESTSVTYFYLRIDDRQRDDWGINSDRYERRAISEKVGVTYR